VKDEASGARSIIKSLDMHKISPLGFLISYMFPMNDCCSISFHIWGCVLVGRVTSSGTVLPRDR
jgi:hypothetical protein